MTERRPEEGKRTIDKGKLPVPGQRFSELVTHYQAQGRTYFLEEFRNTLWNEAGLKLGKELVLVTPSPTLQP